MADLPEPMTPLPYRVRRTVPETHDTFTLELTRPDGKGDLPFAAGQFNMLYAFGVGEVPISISGDPGKPHMLVHTTRAVGAVTEALRRLKKGDLLGVRGPFGTSWPMDKARGHDLVLLAGGIGLAPLRPVLYHLLARRADYGRLALLYGTRTPQDLLYTKDLEQWRGRFDIEVGVTVDHATAGWRGSVGVVTRLLGKAPLSGDHTIAMVCGPEVMMRYAIMDLQRDGVPDENIYLSMERNMKCGIGLCGHCQFGPTFICKDGPVFSFDRIRDWLRKREI
jgi:NAD(P)H-flavin reductase